MDKFNWLKDMKGMRHSGGERHLFLEVLRLHQALHSTFSRAVGRPLSQLALLRSLAVKQPSGAGVMALAREFGVNAAAITRLVQELEKEKLVKRRADQTDARRHYVSLTPKGLKLLAKIHQRAHHYEELLGAGLGAGELETAAKVLAHLRANLAKLS